MMTDTLEERDWEQIFIRARVYRPYYARAMSALTLVREPRLPAPLGVDKYWRLYYNLEECTKYSDDDLAAMIACHEVEHVLRAHCARGVELGLTEDQREYWLMATDCEINDDMDHPVVQRTGISPATFGLPPNLLAEEYYALLEQQAQQQKSKDNCCGGGSGAGSPQDWEADLTGQEMKEIEEKALKQAVAHDVKAHAKKHGIGTVHKGARIWADDLLAPVHIDWARQLDYVLSTRAREITAGRQDYSWRRLSRRQRPEQPLRPGMIKYQPQISVAVDTSGSMLGYGAEVRGVIRSAERHGICSVIQGDAEVTGRSAKMPKEFRGGGGTDMTKLLCAAQKEADLVILVTDSETPWPTSLNVPLVVVTPAGAPPPPVWAKHIEWEVHE